MKSNLKLFVWEDSLEGYSSAGIMFALAESVDDARKVILEYNSRYGIFEKDLEEEPSIYDDKIGFIVFGAD